MKYAPEIDSDEESDFDSDDEEAEEEDDHDEDEDDYEDGESGSPSRKRRSLDDGGRKQGKKRRVDVSVDRREFFPHEFMVGSLGT